jgi:Fur family transcriptional regulator, ferric uptake regulator
MDLTEISETWLEKLQENGYRLTGSRRTVVETIANSSKALSPMEVFDLARTQHTGLGLVTVYRTLEKLEELGLIQRVHQPQGCQAFIAAFTGHQHLILCSACGKVNFFSGDDLEKLFQGIGQQTGFEVQDHWLQLFGLCAECQNSD